MTMLVGKYNSKEEFNEAAVEMLKDLGVRNPEPGVSGSFNVSTGSYRLIEMKTVETTPPVVEMLNQAPGPSAIQQTVEPLSSGPGCNVFPCDVINLLGLECCHTETSWDSPNIRADVAPIRIPQATAHLSPWNPRIEGDIRTQLENNSRKGERCTQQVCRCSDDGALRCEDVEGSATIDENSTVETVVDEMDETLDTVQRAASNVLPDTSVESEAGFRKEGALDLLKSILSILKTGTMRVDANIDTTITYRWRGRSRQRQFSTSVQAVLPVDDVSYTW